MPQVIISIPTILFRIVFAILGWNVDLEIKTATVG